SMRDFAAALDPFADRLSTTPQSSITATFPAGPVEPPRPTWLISLKNAVFSGPLRTWNKGRLKHGVLQPSAQVSSSGPDARKTDFGHVGPEDERNGARMQRRVIGVCVALVLVVFSIILAFFVPLTGHIRHQDPALEIHKGVEREKPPDAIGELV